MVDEKQFAIVQTVARAGEFSVNLRNLVQGARYCMDAGARFVIAPADALDGALPGSLCARASFRLQARAALHALADELSIPLLLASYAGDPRDTPCTAPQPFLLHRGQVKPLTDHRIVNVAGVRVKVDTAREPHLMPPGSADVLLHLPSCPWVQEDTVLSFARKETAESGVPCAVLRSVAYSDGYLSGGGSVVLMPGERCLCLPPFEQVFLPRVPRSVPHSLRPLDSPALMLHAISFALREAVRQGGFNGVALVAASPRVEFLSALARSVLGAQHVFVVQTSPPHGASESRLLRVTLPPNCSHRVRAAILHDFALERNLLLLSTASREEYLCEEPRPGMLAPLADLYESELAALPSAFAAVFPESAPPRAASPTLLPRPSPRELALRLLVDANRCPADISTSTELDESLLRSLMRRIDRTSALRATWSTPSILRIRRPHPIPPCHHRLME